MRGSKMGHIHTYDIRVHRDGRWWMIEIPAIDGLTQARRVADVKKEAIDYIALAIGVAPAQVDVNVSVLAVGKVDFLAKERELEELSAKVRELEAVRAALAEKVAKELAEVEVPMRDIGEVLHVSHQRAHQLVNN